MSIKKSLISLSLASIFMGGQVYAGWGSADVNAGGQSSANSRVTSSQLSPAQKQGYLRQKGQLLNKKKQYQVLIQQVNSNMIKRPDLKQKLQVQLNNYRAQMSQVDTQLAQVNQRLGGGQLAAPRATQQPKGRADDQAVVALAALFDLGGKSMVYFPELIKAKSETERKVVVKNKLANTGYKVVTTRNNSTVIDEGMLFENGSAELLPAAMQRVDNLAALYHRFGSKVSRVVVKGYTNSVGDRAYNLQLSRARSNKVKSELLKRGVPASAVVSQGFGEDGLLPNVNPASPLNRRVEYGVIKR